MNGQEGGELLAVIVTGALMCLIVRQFYDQPGITRLSNGTWQLNRHCRRLYAVLIGLVLAGQRVVPTNFASVILDGPRRAQQAASSFFTPYSSVPAHPQVQKLLHELACHAIDARSVVVRTPASKALPSPRTGVGCQPEKRQQSFLG